MSPTLCNPPSHRLNPSRMTHPHSHPSLFYYLISLLLSCEHKSELWSGYPPHHYHHTYTHRTMSNATICVLTGSAGGTLWISAKTIHSRRVPHTPMLFYSFILETQWKGPIHHSWKGIQCFPLLLKGGRWFEIIVPPKFVQ